MTIVPITLMIQSQTGVTWVTPAAGLIGTFDSGEIFSIDLDATSPAGIANYKYKNPPPDLPIQVTLDTINGALDGYLEASFISKADITWTTPSGTLGTYNEGQSFNKTFVASSTNGPPITYTIIEPPPWGLTLNPTTGKLSGTFLDYTQGPVEPPINIPVWTTPAGSLGTFNEFASVTLTLVATPTSPGTSVDTYSLNDGVLPWGLTLNPTNGKITGNPQDFTKQPNDPITPKPTWTTAAGSLGTVAENASFSKTLVATPASTYTLQDGSLPFGITLNPTTGAVAGTFLPVNTPSEFKSYPFTVRVFDSNKAFEDRAFSITGTS